MRGCFEHLMFAITTKTDTDKYCTYQKSIQIEVSFSGWVKFVFNFAKLRTVIYIFLELVDQVKATVKSLIDVQCNW